MKLRQHVNLGAAFEKLKEALQRAEKYKNDPENEFGYAGAYGTLAGHVETFLFLSTEETMDEIRGKKTDPDDLKDVEVFQQSETGKDIDSDIEKELIN